jgi:hypothetical protein
MRTNEIKALLQKFYEGGTTPEEELLLEGYLLNDEVDPEFSADAEYFRELRDLRLEEIPVPDDLESSLISRLEGIQTPSIKPSRKWLYTVISSAAAVMLLVSSLIFLTRKENSMEINDPQLAYAESYEALAAISAMLNQGTSKLQGLEKMNQAVKPLKTLNSINRAADELSVLSLIDKALNTTNGIVKEK